MWNPSSPSDFYLVRKTTIRMEFSPQDQFRGFIATPQIFIKNALFEYPLYPTNNSITPNSLGKITEPAASVLGKRMEDLFAAYITHFTSQEILLQNQQIIFHKETLGELDFLLKNSASGEISHVELIYKFYVYDPETGASEIEHFIGPNKRDSLLKKLHRLQKRQFPMLFHPATRELLKSRGIDAENILQKMCFKASVFLPKQMKQINFSEINPEAVAGYWISASEFTFKDYGKNAFFTPVKKFWPVLPQSNNTWLSFEEIQQQIVELLNNRFSPLVWMKTPAGAYERFFVVWW